MDNIEWIQLGLIAYWLIITCMLIKSVKSDMNDMCRMSEFFKISSLTNTIKIHALYQSIFASMMFTTISILMCAFADIMVWVVGFFIILDSLRARWRWFRRDNLNETMDIILNKMPENIQEEFKTKMTTLLKVKESNEQ